MANDESNIIEQEKKFNELVKQRRQKLADLQAAGKDPFDVYKVNRTHTSIEVKDNFETFKEEGDVTVAGRLMSKESMVKRVFQIYMIDMGKFSYTLKLMM